MTLVSWDFNRFTYGQHSLQLDRMDKLCLHGLHGGVVEELNIKSVFSCLGPLIKMCLCVCTAVASPAALVGELDGVSPPTSASPAVADAVYPADATVLELPISEKLACHISFPLNEPEVIKTAMYVRRPSVSLVLACNHSLL